MNVATNISSPPPVEPMPTEMAFLKQAGLAREALQTFLAVHKLGIFNVIRPALVDLINYTVRSRFIHLPSKFFLLDYQAGLNTFTNFLKHPVFQEGPPSVFQAVEDFKCDNPKFVIPDKFSRVTGLNSHIRDHLNFQGVPTAPRKGPYIPVLRIVIY